MIQTYPLPLLVDVSSRYPGRPPADEPVIVMCSVVLPMIDGAAPPAEVAEVVAVDALSLTDAGTLFPAVPTGGVAVVAPPPPPHPGCGWNTVSGRLC